MDYLQNVPVLKSFHPESPLRTVQSGGGDPDRRPTAAQSINIEGSHTAGEALELHGFHPPSSPVCWPFCLLFLFGFFLCWPLNITLDG